MSRRDRDGTKDELAADAGDRVRWPAVLAGVAVTLSTLVVLAVLGLALGLSNFDATGSAADYGLRTGVWGGASAVLAFAAGGAVAARSAGGRWGRHGLLHGAVAWATAVPLIVYAFGLTLGAATQATTELAGSASLAAAQIAAPAAAATGREAVRTGGEVVTNISETAERTAEMGREAAQEGNQNPFATKRIGEGASKAGDAMDQVKEATSPQAVEDAMTRAGERLGGEAKAAAGQAADRVTPTKEGTVAAARKTGRAAWGVLGTLVLGLVASSVAGLVAGRRA